MKLLAISGSLRAASLNSLLLRVVARLAPAGTAVSIHDRLARMPLFNPDLEASPPAPVVELRDRIIGSDALIIASPEYAHGVSGPLKNALDWMVGNESFVGKPVAVLNASARASIAWAALIETLTTMSACVVPEACVTVPLLGTGHTEQSLINDPAARAGLGAALRALQRAAARI